MPDPTETNVTPAGGSPPTPPVPPAPPAPPAPPTPASEPKAGKTAQERIEELVGEKKAAEERARKAEAQVAAINAAKAEDERKALEEQGQFKTLLEQERAERAAEKADAEKRINDLTIRGRFESAAAAAGVIDPADAYLLAQRLPQWSEVAVGENGDVAGLDEAITALVEAKPYLVKPKGGTTIGGASRPGETPAPEPPKTQQEADKHFADGLKKLA